MEINHENSMIIYSWFQRAMRRAGRKISLPQNTDPQKTYQYRAVTNFLEKVNGWDLDDSIIQSMVQSIVKYGKQHKLLDKGTMLLSIGSIIDICLKELESREASIGTVVDSIARCREMLDREGLNSYKKLIAPRTLGGFSNLYYLLRADKMPVVYLAVSKRVYRALNEIDREDYPSNRALLKIKARLLLDADIRHSLEDILGVDLNTAGLGVTGAASNR